MQSEERLFTTRMAGPEDETFLYGLYHALRQPEFLAAGLSEDAVEALIRMQFDVRRRAYAIQFPDADQLILNINGTRAGHAIIHRGQGVVTLVDIAVEAGQRGRGIAGRFLAELKRSAASEGVPVRLTVAKENPSAARLYEKHGFSRISESGLFVQMEWTAA